MDKKYEEAISSVLSAKYKIEKLQKEVEAGTYEERGAAFILEGLAGRLEDIESRLNYLAAPTREGTLIMDAKTEKFYIEYDDGGNSYLLSCGAMLEIYIRDRYEDRYAWYYGRVEGRDGAEYFFTGANEPALMEGMRVRKRVLE